MMAVPGQMNVSPQGAFTYSIPIIVPPSTGGMGPALSLDYSSQYGDGPEGIGWVLAGLPTISHCPRTTAQDGIHGGVNYDTNDRFCMNGQRLVAISGTYGADGTQYRTEVESFSEIISHGNVGNGPVWFEVHTKAGQILEFGRTADSAPTAVGKATVRAWAVDKISDTKGNYLTVTYTNDQTNGQAYPIRVDYTGNAAGLSPFASVQFAYTTRSDVVPTYQAGSLMQTTVLLTDIQTYYGTTLVNDYKLAYRSATSAATHDELTSVTLCDGASVCLAPTTFGWQGSRDVLTYTVTANTIAQWSEPTGLRTASTIIPGDYNGDGDTDAIVLQPFSIPAPPCPPTTGNTFFLGDSSGNLTATTPSTGPFCIYTGTSNIPGPLQTSVEGVDFSGDGISDVAYFKSGIGISTMIPILSTGTGFTFFTGVTPANLGDVNGDGRMDIGELLSNGDGTFSAGTFPTMPEAIANEGDFDGDGCADFLTEVNTTTTEIFYNCQPAVATYTTTAVTEPDPTLPLGYILGDFNGDGKTDLIDAANALFLSTGTSLIKQTATLPPSVSTVTTYVGDFNGDGKSDFATYDGSNILVYLSTGIDFFLAATIPVGMTSINVIGVVADWNNDGAADLWIQGSPSDKEILFQYVPELMISVSNGLGATTTATYDRLNKNGVFYTKGTSATYPTQDMDGAQYVVKRIDSSNGIGGAYSSTYAYAGAKNDVSGRGFLGFSQIAITDLQTGIVQTTNYDTAFPLTGMVVSQTKVAPKTGGGTVTIASTVNTIEQVSLGSGTDGVARNFVATHSSVLTSNDEDFSTGNVYALPTVTTTTTYDCDNTGTSICAGTSPTGFGNVTVLAVVVSDGSSKTTSNTWTNDSTDWLLGRLTLATVQSVVPGTTTLTRTSSAAYDMGGTAPSGLVTAQTVEPTATNNLYQNTAIGYDAFGNKTSVTLSSYSNLYGAARATTTVFDTVTYHGQFATKITNALSQFETWAFNANFGVPTSHTGPNGLTTSWGYDTFGRQTLETRPDNNQTTTSYAYCAGVYGGTTSCPTYGAYVVTVTPQNSSSSQNGPISLTYYDALSRVIATDVQGFDASYIRTATLYDADGRVGQTSRPYFVSGGTPKWTLFTYDPLTRVTLATFPDSSTTTNTYCGLTASVKNGDNQTKTTVKNAQSLVSFVVEAASGACSTTGNTTYYLYDAFGNLTKTTDPAGNQPTMTYDLRGRKTASSDPDMGNWSYVYDAFSDLTSQTDAKSQSTSLVYDLLGRITQRVEPSLTSNWVYDTAPMGIGSLASACTGSGCTTPATSSYFRAYSYDSLGRPSTVTLTIAAVNYAYTTTYNSDGHIDTVTYPSGFVAKDVYTSLGYLSQIKDNTTGTAYFTANTRDAELHLTKATAGNSIVTTQQFDPNTGLLQWTEAGTSGSPASLDTYNYGFDVIGNLMNRQDVAEGYTEYFCYDTLNRLQNYSIGASCTASGTKTVAYNAIGNITSKSDAGTYTYGTGTPGPHAVVSIAGTVNGVVNPNFNYDLNGNLTCEYSGASCTGGAIARSVGYTSFNMASSIVEGSTSIGLTYDSEHARTTQTITGSPSGTTAYLNDPASGSMSEQFISGAATTWRDYIQVDGHIVAQRSTTTPPADWGTAVWGSFNWTAQSIMSYFVLDHLGSVTLITDDGGAVNERDSYDAWGKRRNANGTDATSCTIAAATTRGFTNQEMMDQVCLVNLNARIYDPIIARFMAADSVVQDEYSPQTLNRYTYVDNGPLSFTDPTGNDIPANGDMNPFNLLNDPSGYCIVCGGDQAGNDNFATGGGYIMSGHPPSGLTTAGPSGSLITANNSQGVASSEASGPASMSGTGQASNDSSNGFRSKLESQGSNAAAIDKSNATKNTDNYGAGIETVVVTAAKREGSTMPSRLVYDPSKTYHTGYNNFKTIFSYRLINNTGQTLTGKYFVMEHIVPITAVGELDVQTQWEQVDSSGYFKDDVSPSYPPGDEETYQPETVDQTFTVRFNGQGYKLSTEFQHTVTVVKGTTTATTTVIRP